MGLVTISSRLSDFIDLADVSGNIRNNKSALNYLRMIDGDVSNAGITTGDVYPFVGGTYDSHKVNLLNPMEYTIIEEGVTNDDRFIHTTNGIYCKYTPGHNTSSYCNPSIYGDFFNNDLKKVKCFFYKDASTICYSGLVTIGESFATYKAYYGVPCSSNNVNIEIPTPSIHLYSSANTTGSIFFGAYDINDISFYKNGIKYIGHNYNDVSLSSSDRILLFNAVSNQSLNENYKFAMITNQDMTHNQIQSFSRTISIAQKQYRGV